MEWAVGKQGEMMRPNSGKLMLPGSKIVWDIHYSNGGEDITDQVELGIYFYPKGQEPKFRQVLHLMGGTSGTGVSALGSGVDIPPNTVKATEGYFLLRENGRVESYQPHMHLRGKAMTMEAILPNGQIAGAQPRRRLQLQLAQHLRLHRRRRRRCCRRARIIKVTAWHDNTTANKANPDPNVWVGYGDRTVDEMAHAWVNVTYMNDADYRAAIEERRKARRPPPPRVAAAVDRTMRTSIVSVTVDHGDFAMVDGLCSWLLAELSGAAGRTRRRAACSLEPVANTGEADLPHLRGLGAAQGRHQRPAARLLQSQQGRRSSTFRSAPTTASSRAVPTSASRRTSSPGRQYGMFAITVPKDFGTKRLTWTLTRQRPHHDGVVLDQPAVLDRLLQEHRQRQRAAAHQVRADRPRADRPAAREVRRDADRHRRPPLDLTAWAADQPPTIVFESERRPAPPAAGAPPRSRPPTSRCRPSSAAG